MGRISSLSLLGSAREHSDRVCAYRKFHHDRLRVWQNSEVVVVVVLVVRAVMIAMTPTSLHSKPPILFPPSLLFPLGSSYPIILSLLLLASIPRVPALLNDDVQRAALVEFYHATGGNTSWLSAENWLTGDPCELGKQWYGLIGEAGPCTDTITVLAMSNNNLVGMYLDGRKVDKSEV